MAGGANDYELLAAFIQLNSNAFAELESIEDRANALFDTLNTTVQFDGVDFSPAQESFDELKATLEQGLELGLIDESEALERLKEFEDILNSIGETGLPASLPRSFDELAIKANSAARRIERLQNQQTALDRQADREFLARALENADREARRAQNSIEDIDEELRRTESDAQDAADQVEELASEVENIPDRKTIEVEIDSQQVEDALDRVGDAFDIDTGFGQEVIRAFDAIEEQLLLLGPQFRNLASLSGSLATPLGILATVALFKLNTRFQESDEAISRTEQALLDYLGTVSQAQAETIAAANAQDTFAARFEGLEDPIDEANRRIEIYTRSLELAQERTEGFSLTPANDQRNVEALQNTVAALTDLRQQAIDAANAAADQQGNAFEEAERRLDSLNAKLNDDSTFDRRAQLESIGFDPIFARLQAADEQRIQDAIRLKNEQEATETSIVNQERSLQILKVELEQGAEAAARLRASFDGLDPDQTNRVAAVVAQRELLNEQKKEVAEAQRLEASFDKQLNSLRLKRIEQEQGAVAAARERAILQGFDDAQANQLANEVRITEELKAQADQREELEKQIERAARDLERLREDETERLADLSDARDAEAQAQIDRANDASGASTNSLASFFGLVNSAQDDQNILDAQKSTTEAINELREVQDKMANIANQQLQAQRDLARNARQQRICLGP